jgi:integrase
VNERTIDDVVHPHEVERIANRLKANGHELEATYFRYLYFSGMRFNEGLCISVGDLFQDEIQNEFMKKKLKAYGLKYFGYVVSDGQFGGMSGDRVIRIPFKGKKKIEEKANRIVPIIDKVLWNEMVELAAAKHEKWEGKRNSRDCLIFEGIDDSTATVRLHRAFDDEKLKWRSWHALRHSRATWLIGRTADVMLARLFLGHSSPRTIEKYNHIYQAITRSAKANELTGKTFRLKKV